MILAIPSSAEISKLTDIAGKTFTLVSKDKSSGKVRWQSKLRGEIIHYDGKALFYFEEKGEESYQNIKKYKSWDSSAYSYLDGTPYRIKVVVRNQEGKIIENVDKYYDRANNKVFCHVNDQIKEFEFKENLVEKQTIAISLMNYPFEEGRDLDLYLLTNAPALYKVSVEFRGKEKIRVGDQEIECYKLEMLPHLGFFNFFRFFIPKTYFWFETSPPHYFARYEGLESGIGTPYVLTELIR